MKTKNLYKNKTYNVFVCLSLSIMMIFISPSPIYTINIHYALGQNNVSYLPYERNGINIRYPSNWNIQEGVSKYNIVLFSAPSTHSLSPAAVAIHKQELQNATSNDTQKLFNAYSFAQLDYMNKHFGIISVNKTNLLNSSAYQASFKTNSINVLCVWTEKNNFIYFVVYIANDNFYSLYLPTFQQMMSSFTLPTSS